jgi:choline dehydrogenase-like flavoprotein
VGGTTVINSGTALRAHPDAVRHWKEAFGLDEFARRHESIFESLERDLNVAPVPPELTGENTRVFRRGVEALGWRGETLTRAARGCRGAGRCYLGCPNDAKQAMNVSFIPQALAAGARLLSGCRARRIRVEQGRAAGVQTNRGEVRSSAVVVAAGALFTPNLLRTALRHPLLGRNLQVHPAARVIGVFDRDIRGAFEVPQAYHVDQFFDEGISIEGIFLPPSLVGPSLPMDGAALEETMHQFDRLVMIGYRIFEQARGRVLPSVLGFPKSFPLVLYSLARDDVRTFQKATARSAEILFAAGARKVFTGVHPFEELRGPRDLQHLKAAQLSPRDLEVTAYHPQGTCPMADRPDRGVLSPDGETWGVKGLFVADASVLPSTPRHNPQLSIMAMAKYIAEKILERKEVANTPH